MAKLLPRFEVEVTATFTYQSEDYDSDGQLTADTVEKDAINIFYDESHRAEIYGTNIVRSWFECEDCGQDDVEEDHECEAE